MPGLERPLIPARGAFPQAMFEFNDQGEMDMNQETRKVEIFSAGCPACEETIQLVRSIACSSCEIEIHDMHQPAVAAKAKRYGVKTVPAVVINGKLAGSGAGGGVDPDVLRREGVGVPL